MKKVKTEIHSNGKRRILIIAASIIIGSTLLSIAGYYTYLHIKYPEAEVLKGMPNSSIIVAEGEGGFSNFIDSLSSHPVWEHGFIETGMQNHLAVLAKELAAFKGESDATSLFSEQPFAVGLVPKKEAGPAFLFALRLPKGVKPSTVHNFLKNQWSSYVEKKLLELTFFERVLPDAKSLFVTIKGGVLVASTDREVFELGYYTLESGNHILKDKRFVDAREQLAKSRNKAVRVFVSYEGVHTWLTRFVKSEKKRWLALIPDIGYWGAFDYNTSDNAVLFQGFTGEDERKLSIQNVLVEATKNLTDPGITLPAITLFYDQVLIESLRGYRDSYLKSYISKRDGTIERYNIEDGQVDAFMAKMDKHFPECLINAVVSAGDSADGSNKLLIIEMKRSVSVPELLIHHIDSVEYLQYQGFSLYRSSSEYLIPAVFGAEYRSFVTPVYTAWEKYLIVAQSQGTMLTVINQLSSGRLLGNNAGYKVISKQVKGKMSRRIFLDRNEGEQFLKGIIKDDRKDIWLETSPYVPQMFVVSFAMMGGTLLTDIVVEAKPSSTLPKKGGEILLDAPLATSPAVVYDYKAKARKAVCADELGGVYLIGTGGDIEWKMQAMEPPLSKLFVIDLYKNGREQCLFMSKNMLHLVQADGKYVSGFPVKVQRPFQGGLSVFDYEQNGNFRCLYYNTDGHLSNIDLSGKQVAGWLYPKAPYGGYPVAHLNVGGQDLLVHTNEDGFLKLYDRRGKVKTGIEQVTRRSKKSDIGLVTSNGQPLLTWLDDGGAIQHYTAEGTQVVDKVLVFNPLSSLVFRPGGGFVVSEPDTLSVYDRNLSLEAKVHLPSPITADLQASVAHSGILVYGKGEFSEPLAVSADGYKFLNINTVSTDYFIVWQGSSAGGGYALMAKGRVLILQPL